jgi:hypothetical protein
MTRLLLLIALTAGCPSRQVVIQTTCGHASNQTTCIGQIRVPEKYRATVTQGAALAIDALHSPEFHRQLKLFIESHGADTDIRKEWNGLTAEGVIRGMRAQLHGIKIDTFGGARGFLKLKFYGTRALERPAIESPIGLNRWSLRNTSPESIANTIIHEVAHAIGLKHPHSSGRGKKWTIAQCEPPYVLGSIAERVLRAQRRTENGSHCKLLDDL